MSKFKTLKFFLSEAKKNSRKTLIVLFIFGISISLLSAFTYGADALEKDLTKEIQTQGTPQISDLNFLFITDSLISTDYGTSLISEIHDRITPIKNTFRYAIQYGERVNFVRYKPNFSNYGFDEQINYYYSPYMTIIGDNNFYNSSRLYDMVEIIDGGIPSAENEILIDFSYAQVYNYSVGQEISFQYEMFFSNFVGYMNVTSDRAYKIAGIYIPQESEVQLGPYQFLFDYRVNFENKTLEFLNRQTHIYGKKTIVQNIPIFCYSNFSAIRSHPVFVEIEESQITFDIANWYTTSIGVNLNFDLIEFDQINLYLSQLNNSLSIILESRESRIIFQSAIISNLDSLKLKFQRARILIPLLNIPLLFFAIIMGSMAIKNDIRNRMEEFLILRSKGASISLIRNEMLFEALIQGILSAILGSILGIPLFYGIRTYMNQIFLGMNLSELTFILKANSIVQMFIISLIAIIFASFTGIILITRQPIYKIVNRLKQNSLEGSDNIDDLYKEDIDYTSFLELDETEIEEKSLSELSEKEKKLKIKDHKKKQKKLRKIYNITKHRQIEKKMIISAIFLFCGLLPVFIILLGSWGQNPNSPDIVYNLYENNKILFSYSIVLVLFTPFFITLSIIRFFGIDRPHFLARFSRRITKPLIGKLSKLLGIEFIRRRQYVSLTSIIGVFISLIVFINIFITSNLNIPVVEKNLASGADANIQYSTEIVGQDPYLNDGNVSKLQEDLKNLNFNNQNIVNDVLNLYLTVPLSEIQTTTEDPLGFGGGQAITTTQYSHFMIYANISKLYHFLYDKQKFDYTDTKQMLNNFASNISDNGTPNCIVSDRYLFSERKSTGNLIQVPHSYQNEELEIIRDPIEARIFGSSDNIPGLWLKSIGESLEEMYEVVPFGLNSRLTVFVLMDISVLDSIPHNLNNFTIGTMLDFNDDFKLSLESQEEISKQVQNISLQYNWATEMNFYYNSQSQYLALIQESMEIFLVNYGFLVEFAGIGIIIAFSIGILSISLYRDNIFFNHLLKSKGIGKKGLFKFFLVLLLAIFLIGLLIGGLIGIITSILLFKSNFFIRTFVEYQATIPLSLDLQSMVIIISIIPLVTLSFMILFYFFGKDKAKTIYQREF